MVRRTGYPVGKDTSPWARIIHTSRGLTILELIIAFVVLQIALVTFAQFITRALDYSRRVRHMEMAQILGQAKMEELVRTIPREPRFRFAPEDRGTARVFPDRPGTFEESVFGHSEDISPFRWVAEIMSSAHNPRLVNLNLYVYVTRSRMKAEKVTTPFEDFFLSDDRERFAFTHTLSDGSVEVVRGIEKLRLSTAVALEKP